MSAQPKPTNRSRPGALLLPAMVVAAATLTGCESGNGGAGNSAPNTGLSNLGGTAPASDLRLLSTIDPNQPLTDSVKQELAAQAALDLQSVLDGLDPSAPPSRPNASQTPAERAPTRSQPSTKLAPSAGLGALEPSNTTSALADAPALPETPREAPLPAPAPKALEAADSAWSSAAPTQTDPLLELATNMAGLLKNPSPDGSPRVADAVALAAIEAMHPGSVAELESASSGLGQRLAPDDRAALLAARQRILSKPDQANAQLVAALSKLTPSPGVKISRSALCTRVQGFGRYDAVANSTFVAGKPIRLIVYTELDQFASRPAREGDPAQANVPLGEQKSVELSQTLTLYHDGSGLQAWHRPAQRVVETTQRSRRDFYLIHQIELPATLTVGRYSLKVVVTDQTTGAVDEVNLPITITGDASALPK